MRRSRIGRGALLSLAVALLVGLWPVQSLAATASDVPTKQEAWYQVAPNDPGEEADPSCALPVGCAPQPGLPANPYPEKTLQVGVAGGRDTARTFLSLDLADLPSGALISGGTLILPVLAGQDAGSLRPETARLSACSVIGDVKSAEGGEPDQQPDFSCAASAKATYKAGETPTVSIDLTLLASTLSMGGIAIVPSKAAHDEGDTWRIAFPARDHAAKEQISATLNYDKPMSLGTLTPPAPPAPDPGFDSTSSAGAIDSPAPAAAPPASFADPVPDAPAPAAAAPEVAPVAPAPATVPAAFGYAYPASWLAPLVLLAIAGALARTLTGEITLPDDDGAAAVSPNLLERLGAALRAPAAAGSAAQSPAPQSAGGLS